MHAREGTDAQAVGVGDEQRPRRAAARRALDQIRMQSQGQAESTNAPSPSVPAVAVDKPSELEPERSYLSETNLPMFMHFCRYTHGMTGAELAAVETAAVDTLYVQHNHRAAWEYVIAAGRDRYRSAVQSAEKGTSNWSSVGVGAGSSRRSADVASDSYQGRGDEKPPHFPELPSDAASRRRLLAAQYEQLLARKAK